MTVEEHGEGRQLVRTRSWAVPSRAALGLCALLATLAVLAYVDGAFPAGALMALAAAGLAGWCLRDCSASAGALRAGIRRDAETYSGELPPAIEPRAPVAQMPARPATATAGRHSVPGAAPAPRAGAVAHALPADGEGVAR